MARDDDKQHQQCIYCRGAGYIVGRGTTDGQEWKYACNHDGTFQFGPVGTRVTYDQRAALSTPSHVVPTTGEPKESDAERADRHERELAEIDNALVAHGVYPDHLEHTGENGVVRRDRLTRAGVIALNLSPSTPSATGTSDLERFYERICEIAMKRQQGYAERRHGGVLNGECMDAVVEVCKEASGARLRESIKATDGGNKHG